MLQALQEVRECPFLMFKERGLPLDFGHSKQLSLNKFFDPITPSLLVGDHPWWVTILVLVADRVWKGV